MVHFRIPSWLPRSIVPEEGRSAQELKRLIATTKMRAIYVVINVGHFVSLTRLLHVRF